MNQIYRITVIGIKKIAIYREFLFFSILKNIIYIFIQYMLWSNILAYQNKQVELPVLMTYFLLNQFLSVLHTNISMTISDDIREGTIIHRLCKPVPLEKQYFFESLGSSVAKVATISIMNIAFIIVLTDNFSLFILIQTFFLIITGYVLNFVMELFFGSLAFFTQSIWGIDSLKQALMTVFSGSIFPLFLYPNWLKQIVSFLPFSLTIGKISEFYIFKIDFSKILLVQFIYIILIFILYKMVMKICIKRLTVNGG
ncbi:ABC-2 family transporter protein [Streptobacillus moniliformis]|uniref:ABC transporter permease n=1 Tax=Streptobacillus TaxID=34104 RepID=UPI0007E37278|nr:MULTISPECIES: ABC-2 family transporter protein [Streptobacillus]QXW66008.1 ABC-2 family transporter protein [Streptobacillus moniliformis]